jgi:uncharacterized protein YqgV (UPF0045/DUF77 family)
MQAWAHIELIPNDTDVQSRREAAMARGVLLKAGLDVPLHASGTDVQGDVDALMLKAERVRAAVKARGIAHLTTLVKMGSAWETCARAPERKTG